MARLTIELINRRVSGTGVKVEQRGGRLALRATLPNRSGYGNSQTRISLGVPATDDGLAYALGKAHELAGQIAQKTFDWKLWRRPGEKVEGDRSLTIEDWVERFKAHKLASGLKESSWVDSVALYMRRLPPGELLTGKILIETALTWEPNTQARRTACMRYAELARLAGIQVDFSQYRGRYNSKHGKGRSLPTDEELIQQYHRFPNNHRSRLWRNVFARMVTYGLRDHEAILAWVDHEGHCHVKQGKTGARTVPPIYPEWVEEFKLIDAPVPKIDPELPHSEIGRKVCQALGRYLRSVSWGPYDCRHAYAVRGGVRFGYPPRLMAQWMGHGVGIHLNTYQHWISLADSQAGYLAGLERSDRPKPPAFPPVPEL